MRKKKLSSEEGIERLPNDIEIWSEVTSSLCKEYGVTKRELYRLIVFSFPGCGFGHLPKGEGTSNNLSIGKCLDLSMRELRKALRRTVKYKEQLGSLWKARQKYSPVGELREYSWEEVEEELGMNIINEESYNEEEEEDYGEET